jgi:sulfite exporter TauE/SafE
MDSGLAVLLAAMLAAGLASGVHCVGMCGGIVAAFDSARVIPVRPAGPGWARRLAFNAGRITTYAAAGAAAGTIGAAAIAAAALPLQSALQVAASLVLVAVGLHLAGATAVLAPLERAGGALWRLLRPAAAQLMRAHALPRAYAAGLVWGGVPCAMVYGALTAAAFSGGAAQGTLAMAAFGAGTLPFLLAAGWLAAWLRRWRAAIGAAVLASGVWGLAHAGALGETVRRGLLIL